jgi:hypothetical protein
MNIEKHAQTHRRAKEERYLQRKKEKRERIKEREERIKYENG